MSGAATIDNAGVVTLATVPVSKGGTGATSFTANRMIASDGTGASLIPFNCALGEVVTFDVAGVVTCVDLAAAGSGFFKNGGNAVTASSSIGNNANYDFNFVTNSTSRMTVKADGKVGIGTSSPSQTLDVAGGIKATSIVETQGFWDVAPLGTATATGGLIAAGGPQFRGSASLWSAIPAGDTMTLDLGAIYPNVGIISFGTVYRNDVNYTPKDVITSVSSDCSTYTTVGSETGNLTKTSFFYAFSERSVRCVQIQVVTNQSGYVSNIASLRVLSTAFSGGHLSPMVVNGANTFLANTGNLGLGIKAPAYKLDVVGDVNVTGNFRVNGTILGAGSGTVTGVTATAPVVSSGGNAPVISMAAATASVPGYLTAADFTTFNSKLGAATVFAGDLSGTYGATSVDKIQGKSVVPGAYAAGQTLRYDGSQWINAALGISDTTG
ncbi:MAG: hypothetical protein EOO39_36410, partial [Cytophagaceae bacterium]